MSIDTYALTEQIRKIVESETLTGKGLQAFTAALDKVQNLERDIGKANELIKKQEEEIAILSRERSSMKAEIERFKAAHGQLAERESAITNLEKKAAVCEAVAETWEKACGLVFRNTTIRESMYGQVPRGMDANPNNYHSSDTVQTSTDVTRTVE